MNFLKKLGYVCFKILHLHIIMQKTEKTNSYLEKPLTVTQTGKSINKQTDISNFIGPSVYGGPVQNWFCHFTSIQYWYFYRISLFHQYKFFPQKMNQGTNPGFHNNFKLILSSAILYNRVHNIL